MPFRLTLRKNILYGCGLALVLLIAILVYGTVIDTVAEEAP